MTIKINQININIYFIGVSRVTALIVDSAGNAGSVRCICIVLCK